MSTALSIAATRQAINVELRRVLRELVRDWVASGELPRERAPAIVESLLLQVEQKHIVAKALAKQLTADQRRDLELSDADLHRWASRVGVTFAQD